VQTDANKSDVAGLPSIFLGVSALPGVAGAVGFAQRTGAVTVTPHYGADQTGTTTLALTDSAGHSFFQATTNLFDTQPAIASSSIPMRRPAS